jgi:hypothetical protein
MSKFNRAIGQALRRTSSLGVSSNHIPLQRFPAPSVSVLTRNFHLVSRVVGMGIMLGSHVSMAAFSLIWPK